MIIDVHTDNHIRNTENLVTQVRGIVENALDIHALRLSRVIVHLGDENGARRSAGDKRCLLEARVESMPDLVITHHGDDLIPTLHAACEKMDRALSSALSKRRDQRYVSIEAANIH